MNSDTDRHDDLTTNATVSEVESAPTVAEPAVVQSGESRGLILFIGVVMLGFWLVALLAHL